VDALVTAFLDANPQFTPKTRAIYYFTLKMCIRAMGVTDWRKVAAPQLDSLITYLAVHGYSPHSRRRAYVVLRSFARYLHGRGIDLPVERLPRRNFNKQSLGPLSPQELGRLLAQPAQRNTPQEKRDAIVLCLLWATGMTSREMCALSLGDYDGAALAIKGRIMPIYPYARTLLDDYLRTARPALCHDAAGGALIVSNRGAAISMQEIQYIVRQAGRAAGIDSPVNPHRIRLTFAWYLLQQGVNGTEISALIGLAVGRLPQRYRWGRKRRRRA